MVDGLDQGALHIAVVLGLDHLLLVLAGLDRHDLLHRVHRGFLQSVDSRIAADLLAHLGESDVAVRLGLLQLLAQVGQLLGFPAIEAGLQTPLHVESVGVENEQVGVVGDVSVTSCHCCAPSCLGIRLCTAR